VTPSTVPTCASPAAALAPPPFDRARGTGWRRTRAKPSSSNRWVMGAAPGEKSARILRDCRITHLVAAQSLQVQHTHAPGFDADRALGCCSDGQGLVDALAATGPPGRPVPAG